MVLFPCNLYILSLCFGGEVCEKIISILMVVFMVLSILGTSVWADSPSNGIDIWDGTVATAFAGGDGSAQNPFLISSGAQLAHLNDIIGESFFEGKAFKITKDIDLNNLVWTPIGDQVTYYYDEEFNSYSTGGYLVSVTIDGDYHKITNLNVEPTKESAGLFGTIYGSTLKNITIENATIVGKNSRVGLLAGPV